MIDTSRIQAIGFDLDGTLYPITEQTEDAQRRSMARTILRLKPDFGTFDQTYRYVIETYPKVKSYTGVIAQATNRKKEEIGTQWILDARIEQVLAPDPRLASLLKNLNTRRKVLYILTSSPEESVHKKLNALEIPVWIFNMLACDDTPNIGSKSNGTAFEYVIKQTGIPASNHLYVGDREMHDILPAKRLGMQTCAVWSYIPEADCSIKTIYELETLLKSEK